MNWQKQSKKLLAGCAIMIAAGVIGGMYAGLSTASGQEAPVNERTGQVWNVPTANQAATIAQYAVAKPEFIPSGFVSVGNIAVIRHRVPGDVFTVVQTWRDSANKSTEISLVQNPELDGVAGGEPTEIRGVTGQKVLNPAFESRPELLSLYWREGGMSYVLTGTVNSVVDEETLRKVALSVK